MECTIYVGRGASSELYYVLDIMRVTGEVAHFLWHTQTIADFLHDIFND